MKQRLLNSDYFPFDIPISERCGRKVVLRLLLEELGGAPGIIYARRLAAQLNRQLAPSEPAIQPGLLHLYSVMNRVFRYLMGQYCEAQQPGVLARLMVEAGYPGFTGDAGAALARFLELFPSQDMVHGRQTAEGYLAGDDAALSRRGALAAELFLLRLTGENRALDSFRQIFDSAELAASSPYLVVSGELDRRLARAPRFEPIGLTLPELLRAPVKASPDSLAGQIAYIKEHWAAFLPSDLLAEILTAMDIVAQEERSFSRSGGPGEAQVLGFGRGAARFAAGGDDYPEFERFSRDADWMANVVMIAKMVYVWLGQLSKTYGVEVHTLDQIPDAELDRLSRWGFSGLWLIGIWERSPASQRIKHITGNPDAISSAYSLYDYVIANDLGGEGALDNLKRRCAERGIRLASDMVPNHTGLYSKWILEHPDWFIQLDYPPYPDYTFNGPDLSNDGRVGLFIEDGYWDKRDAAVVFKYVNRETGRVRYIYHGNDGTSTPWNDTAQLNYLIPDVREAVIGTILHVARQFPIIRFDAAMTLAKKHYQRLWFPLPGHGSVPSRAEHGMDRPSFDAVFPTEFWRDVVDRVAVEAPDTLLLAEAFWLMEGYFVRTLGMHRVYNSAFMNMLKMQENAKYRQTLKNVLEFEPEILKRFVNFMNNPDERTAVEQFGKEGKYFGATVLLVTMPGLPMFGHGQIEGFHEKYGMEYRRAYWDEPVDQALVARHESNIFPLMRRRHIFSGSEQFVLYDFFAGSQVDENVFAYSNRSGGERGLILYHNCFADTAGWIKFSCASARKDVAGGALVQRSLGDALDFNGDGRHYYAFRDFASGLSYLRSGRDLCDQGLYVEMGGYEYHAFLDFREIRDDEFGTWGALCYKLNGAGVASIEEEVKQVRFASANEALRALLAKTVGAADEPEADASLMVPLLEPLMASFLKAVAPQAKETAQRSLLVSFGTEMTQALRPPAAELAADPGNQLLLCAFLALHRVGALSGAESEQILDAFGLVRPVVEVFGILPVPTDEQPGAVLPPWGWGDLLRVLLRHETFLVQLEAKGALASCSALCADPAAADFLLLHESAGIQWFNKERFELLLTWFSWLSPYAVGGLPQTKAALEGSCALLIESAEAAGYRLDYLLKLLGKLL